MFCFFFLLKEHLEKKHLHISCEHCEEQFNSVDTFTHHTLVCDKITIDCVLKPYGCDESVCKKFSFYLLIDK